MNLRLSNALLALRAFKICFQRMTCYAIVENVKIHTRLYVSVIKSARGKLPGRLFFFELVSRDIVINSFMLKLQNLYAERNIVWMHFNFLKFVFGE